MSLLQIKNFIDGNQKKEKENTSILKVLCAPCDHPSLIIKSKTMEKNNLSNLVTKHINMHIHGYVCEGKA
jgi:hypothetical protein